MPTSPPMPVSATKMNDPILFKPPGASKEELYVMTLVDTTNQIFQGTKKKDNTVLVFSPSEQVKVILPPASGAKILSF